MQKQLTFSYAIRYLGLSNLRLPAARDRTGLTGERSSTGLDANADPAMLGGLFVGDNAIAFSTAVDEEAAALGAATATSLLMTLIVLLYLERESDLLRKPKPGAEEETRLCWAGGSVPVGADFSSTPSHKTAGCSK